MILRIPLADLPKYPSNKHTLTNIHAYIEAKK